MRIGEKMEPALVPVSNKKDSVHQCPGCYLNKDFLLPVSRLCCSCYNEMDEDPIPFPSAFRPTQSRDDTYVALYLWFLEQQGYCSGKKELTENTIKWMQTSEEVKRSKKAEREAADSAWQKTRKATGIENYLDMLRTRRQEGWSTGANYQEWYNNLDVVPLLDVV